MASWARYAEGVDEAGAPIRIRVPGDAPVVSSLTVAERKSGDAQIMSPTIELKVKCPVVDEQLSGLHARAFGYQLTDVKPWTQRLERHSLTWVGAFIDEQLVGFVHACWDGGAHAFLLDTAVEPDRQRSGIGARLVRAIVDETTAAGCEWLHVDYEPRLAAFYTEACGFSSTSPGLRRLTHG